MRFWDRLRDPDRPQTRSRSALRPAPGSAAAQWGQRPMFSEPGPDQPPPDDGRLAAEIQLDRIIPVDESKGSEARTDFVKSEGAARTVLLPFSLDNVSSPPTNSELDAIFGNPPAGYAAIITDAGVAGIGWFVIKRADGHWAYEALSEAV